MFKKILDKKGYTLVELLLIIGLVGVVSVPLFLTFTTGLTVYESETRSNSDVSELRNFQLNFNDFIRTQTIGDIKTKRDPLSGVESLLIDGKIYIIKDDNLISKDEATSDEITLLENVNRFEISNITKVSDDVTYFDLLIEVEDHNETFEIETSYKIRGDH